MGRVGDEIKKLDDDVKEIDAALRNIVLAIPNIPDKSLPIGGEQDYRVERTWGEPKQFDFEAKGHWDIGEKLNILDFERATKVTAHPLYFLPRFRREIRACGHLPHA